MDQRKEAAIWELGWGSSGSPEGTTAMLGEVRCTLAEGVKGVEGHSVSLDCTQWRSARVCNGDANVEVALGMWIRHRRFLVEAQEDGSAVVLVLEVVKGVKAEGEKAK